MDRTAPGLAGPGPGTQVSGHSRTVDLQPILAPGPAEDYILLIGDPTSSRRLASATPSPVAGERAPGSPGVTHGDRGPPDEQADRIARHHDSPAPDAPLLGGPDMRLVRVVAFVALFVIPGLCVAQDCFDCVLGIWDDP